METKRCLQCNKQFPKSSKYGTKRWDRTIFCSTRCSGDSHTLKLKRICAYCKKAFLARRNQVKVQQAGKFCSHFCSGKYRWKITPMSPRYGEDNNKWKGDNAGYNAIHIWIRTNFGKANRCENPKCLKKSSTFEYSLMFGKSYTHNRENFWMLCVSCHRKYDRNSL